jgi:hypothetical protein
MTAPQAHEPPLSVSDLIAEVNLLLKDYSLIHSAPKSITSTLIDVKYLHSTLVHLEILLGDPSHILHIPSPAQVITSTTLNPTQLTIDS